MAMGAENMRYASICGLLVTLSCPVTLLALESPQLHYAPYTKQIIPETIEMSDQASIAASVGDVYLQSPIIKVKINGQGPFLFMFDTGFSDSVISRSLAKKLKLPIIHSYKNSITTTSQVVDTFEDMLMAQTIEMGDIVIKNYGMAASSFYEDDIDEFRQLKVDGILSAAIFYGKLITLDYKKEQIQVKNGALNSTDKDVLTSKKGALVPIIQGTIKFDKLKKEEPQEFLIDTGDSAYIYVSACRIPEMKKFKNQERLTNLDMYQNTHHTALAELYGDIIFTPSVVLKSPYITFSALHCHQPTGRLGRKFFENYEVTLDQKNNLVKIKRY